MQSHDAHEWPRSTVRVAEGPAGARLHFPALRGLRSAARLLLIGCALAGPAAYAAFTYTVHASPDASARLTLALTATVVYPVLAFGLFFIAMALHKALESLTVEVDGRRILCVHRWVVFKYAQRRVAAEEVARFELVTAAAPRALGGTTQFYVAAVLLDTRIVRVTAPVHDENLGYRLKALFERQLAGSGKMHAHEKKESSFE